jgi:hypothetical protein
MFICTPASPAWDLRSLRTWAQSPYGVHDARRKVGGQADRRRRSETAEGGVAVVFWVVVAAACCGLCIYGISRAIRRSKERHTEERRVSTY